jgi:hypothetical protein
MITQPPDDSPCGMLAAWTVYTVEMAAAVSAAKEAGETPRRLGLLQQELDRAGAHLAEALAGAIHAKGRWGANHRSD